MPGPGPRTAPRGQKLDLKANMGTIMRVLKYVCKRYGLQMVIVVVCIVITVLSINFFGDGVRDALDPKMKI